MSMVPSAARRVALIASALAALGPVSALAQQQPIEYQPVGPVAAPPPADATAAMPDTGAPEGVAAPLATAPDGARARDHRRTRIRPYIELDQTVLDRFSPDSQVMTYTTLAAGVDAAFAGRHTTGTLSVRYERRISETRSRLGDSDALDGIARISHELVPHVLALEAGAFAARTRVDPAGNASLTPLASGDHVSQIYSLYGGPALNTHSGDVALTGSYLVGYTKARSPGAVIAGSAPVVTDVFDHSVSQQAQLAATTRPGDALPVGLGARATYNREDVSNLSQRAQDFRGEGQVTVPLGDGLALVGGAGYEYVRVSSRDALRDANGNYVIGGDGRLVTDSAAPRRIAYDTSGLVWDAGVVWRPSRRTDLEAFVGRRYGGTTYWGSFNYLPNARSSLNVSVYQSLSGLGSQLAQALNGLPSEFLVTRDPFTGGVGGCAVGAQGGGCVNNALSSAASDIQRITGVNAVYGHRIGRWQAALGAGWVRRRYIGAAGTALGTLDGIVDHNVYVDAQLGGPLSRRSSFSTMVYANWYDSGLNPQADTRALGARAGYSYAFSDKLTGTAALGLDGIERKVVDDEWIGSALVGLRYNF